MKIPNARLLALPFLLVLVWAPPASGTAQRRSSADQNISLRKRPHINQIIVHCDSAPCTEFDIRGVNFGAARGSRELLIDGQAPSHYEQWSDTQISIGISAQVYSHVYKWGIYEGSKLISNTVQRAGSSVISVVDPAKAHVGASIRLSVIGVAGAQGARNLKMDKTPMTILSWTNDGPSVVHIVANVPALPLGTHAITLYDRSKAVSKLGGGRTFTIY